MCVTAGCSTHLVLWCWCSIPKETRKAELTFCSQHNEGTLARLTDFSDKLYDHRLAPIAIQKLSRPLKLLVFSNRQQIWILVLRSVHMHVCFFCWWACLPVQLALMSSISANLKYTVHCTVGVQQQGVASVLLTFRLNIFRGTMWMRTRTPQSP